MDADDLAESLRLLDRADQLLTQSGELVLAARLLAVIEPLRERARAAELSKKPDNLTHSVQ